jgi:dsRNA-specific ribonuclease
MKNGVRIVDKPSDCLALRTKSNERLEFLGDGVLECITKYYLYRRFPKGNEGFMTEKKIALVKNESIGKMAYEMGLNRWYIMSKNAEEKKTRTNLKKLGCLFEAFLGALFLDFNKISIEDEHKWFSNVFVTGPGFQIAQIFVEHIFEQHVNWVELLQNDDNYKNILQVRIQKAFKTTPVYSEITPHSDQEGYHMGVYLCLGQDAYGLKHRDATPYRQLGSFAAIQQHQQMHQRAFIFLGASKHKIKKKAEQKACELALNKINK